MKVYLINVQDRYCPENNNGENIIEVYSSLKKAQKRAKHLDKVNEDMSHQIFQFKLNETLDGRLKRNYRKYKAEVNKAAKKQKRDEKCSKSR